MEATTVTRTNLTRTLRAHGFDRSVTTLERNVFSRHMGNVTVTVTIGEDLWSDNRSWHVSEVRVLTTTLAQAMSANAGNSPVTITVDEGVDLVVTLDLVNSLR
jgi:hypothetical protein